MIQELGLRYRPNGQGAEEHGAKVALLAEDCSDVPPAQLKAAISRWVMKSPYLPKASELIALAKEALVEPSQPYRQSYDEFVLLQRQCDDWNRSMKERGMQREYFVDGQKGWHFINYN